MPARQKFSPARCRRSPPTAADVAKLAMFESAWFGQGPAFWRWVDTPEAEPYVAAFIEQQTPPKPGEYFGVIGGFDDDEGLSILDTTDFARLTAEIEAKYGDAGEGE